MQPPLVKQPQQPPASQTPQQVVTPGSAPPPRPIQAPIQARRGPLGIAGSMVGGLLRGALSLAFSIVSNPARSLLYGSLGLIIISFVVACGQKHTEGWDALYRQTLQNAAYIPSVIINGIPHVIGKTVNSIADPANAVNDLFSARDVLVCQPKHINRAGETVLPDMASENQYAILTELFRQQIDREGGNVATPVKQVLDAGNYPVIVLPRLTDGQKTSNIRLVQAEHASDQKCENATGVVGYPSVKRSVIPSRHFDW